MIHITLFDNVHFSDLKEMKELKDKNYGLLVSVNAHADLSERTRLHQALRFNDFCCFNKCVKEFANEMDELYLKYGGLCFLWDRDLYRYREVEDNLNFVCQFDYVIDEFGNNDLLNRSSNLAVIDKHILKLVFQEKNPKLIYLRPKKSLEDKPKEEIIEILKGYTGKDLYTSEYFENCI